MSRRQDLFEVAALFLRLGATAFGGPAAHIAMMHNEVVRRRKWMSDAQFMDLLGATNLIPGPNSTEMAIHTGYARAGRLGLVVAGVCFILPAMLIVLALAWGYVRFGALPEVDGALYGIKPVVIAIVLQALLTLGRSAVKGPATAATGMLVFGLTLMGVNELALLTCAGATIMLASNLGRIRGGELKSVLAVFLPRGLAAASLVGSAPFSLPLLFLTFLKIGAVLYGSGYVLLAFVRADFVTRLGWLTDRQLLDAIAVGQVTPGPVFTTATFIGFLLAGVPGALLATLGIFLPAFIFVALSVPLLPRLRSSTWFAGLLDGVNAAALGLMAAVTLQLGRTSLVDLATILIFLICAAALWRFKINPTWLILGGALIGVLRPLFLG